MLNSLEIHNFQSLKDLKLELGNFTVIVGESSSGKSALVRSLEALSSNIRGSSFVTVGEKVSTVSAWTDRCKITFKKGDGHSSYSLCDSQIAEEREFTKLASGVPSEVTAKLGIDPMVDGYSINFAGQHDNPFLLKDSGAAVARVLGELTNVSTLFEAVREANRRRTGANSVLKVRQEDFKAVKIQIETYANLQVEKAAIDDIDRLYSQVLDLVELMGRLQELLIDLDSYTKARSIIIPEDIPDFLTLQRAYDMLCSYQRDLVAWNSYNVNFKESAKKLADSSTELENLKLKFHETLEDAGECPLCGQEVTTSD
jgi:DNA repair ATPase RecN